MDFKSQTQVVDHCIKEMGMTKEKAEEYATKHYGDLPLDVTPEMEVVTPKAVMDEVNAKLAETEKAYGEEIEGVKTQLSKVEEDNKKLEKELVTQKELVSMFKPGDGVKDTQALKFGFKSCFDFVREAKECHDSGQVLTKTMKEYKEHYRNYIDDEVKNGNIEAKAAGSPTLSSINAEDGLYLVPVEFDNQIKEVSDKSASFIEMADSMELTRSSLAINYIDGFDESDGTIMGGVNTFWKDQLADFEATKFKIGQLKLELNKLTALGFISDELEDDSPFATGNRLVNAFGKAIGRGINKVMINGDGVGKPEGILNAAGQITITAEGGQGLSILIQNIAKMMSQIWAEDGDQLVWVASRSIIPQLLQLTIAVGTGGGSAIFMPNMNVAGKPFDTLYGIPIMFSRSAPALGTKGDLSLVNWSEYMLANKAGQGIKSATSIHFKFTNEQTTIRVSKRIDGKIWWPSTFTDEQGLEFAPVVNIATRS